MMLNKDNVISNKQPIENHIIKLIKDMESVQLPNKATAAFKYLTKITLSSDDNLIERLIAIGAIPVIINKAKRENHSAVQMEAAWALNNIVIGHRDHVNVVMKAGAIPVLRDLLSSNCLQVCEQSVTAIANVISTDRKHCEEAVNKAIVRAIVPMFYNYPNSPIIVRRVGCILRDICKVKLCITLVKIITPVLLALIYQSDKDTKLDALYAIGYLTESKDCPLNLLNQSGILKHLILFLNNTDIEILTVALQVLGDFLKGTSNHVKFALDNNIIQYLETLVIHNDTVIRKNALMCVAEIVGKNLSYGASAISRQMLVKIFINLTDEDFEINKQTLYVLMYLTALGSNDHILTLVNMDCIPIICSMLEYSKCEIIKIILQVIKFIIERSMHNFPKVMSIIGNHFEFNTLQYLMEHENEDIKTYARCIFMNLSNESCTN